MMLPSTIRSLLFFSLASVDARSGFDWPQSPVLRLFLSRVLFPYAATVCWKHFFHRIPIPAIGRDWATAQMVSRTNYHPTLIVFVSLPRTVFEPA
jgi:hypothetical protein